MQIIQDRTLISNVESLRPRDHGPPNTPPRDESVQRRLDSRGRRLSSGAWPSRGFTLIELIVVLTLVGIMAAVAIPKFQSIGIYTTLGFYDKAQAIMRFAQKQAVAKRRNVCVNFSSTTITLTYASAAGSASACNTSLTIPESGSANSATASSGVTFTPAPAISQLTFNALGQASTSATFTVSDSDPSNTRTFSVEAVTGYVH